MAVNAALSGKQPSAYQNNIALLCCHGIVPETIINHTTAINTMFKPSTEYERWFSYDASAVGAG
jgi:hypothetical protein